MKSQTTLHTLKVLDFDKVITLLSKFAVSEAGRSFCQSLRPVVDLSVIRERLSQVTEMKLLIMVTGLLPLWDLADVAPLIRKAEPEGSFLAPLEMCAIVGLIRSSFSVRGVIGERADTNPTLWRIAEKIKVLSSLESELTSAIDNEGEILDTASKELLRIRNTIRKVREQVRTVLERIMCHPEHLRCMQERIITVRNERYVIPVKADFRSRIPGVVHDHSKNMATYFIEPFDVVELNNELIVLMKGEDEEKLRILRDLTCLIRENKWSILENQGYLSVLDSAQAKARLSERMRAREPELVAEKDIKIVQARHPLLLWQPPAPDETNNLPDFENQHVVPIDIIFSPEFSTMVISGANMGGKTAALKTIGLLSLMVQSGMHIPAGEGSHLPVWEGVFADIGDEQDLAESVSTFSSHISQVTGILREANNRSLVLLDELGAGTDPQEGAALALAILDALREKKAKVVITTHLNQVKAHAAVQAQAVNVSVSFDTISLRPAFSLLYGVPGSSNAFEIATRLGLDDTILGRAKNYLTKQDRRLMELAGELEEKIKELEQVRTACERTLSSALQYETKVSRLVEELVSKQERIAQAWEAKAGNLFREAEARVKVLMRSNPTPQTKHLAVIQEEMKSRRHQIMKDLGSRRRASELLDNLKVGDPVFLGKGKTQGRIAHVDYDSKRVEVHVEGLRLKASIEELSQMHSPHDIPKGKDSPASSAMTLAASSEGPGFFSPLKVVGLTVDEAIPTIDKAIDHAFLYGVEELRIIHGIGTGRLKSAIHEHLKQQPLIKSFAPASIREGGAGITIVELRS